MMTLAAMPEPFIHPHTSAPIDLERLEQINLEHSWPRNRGRTTAFVVHMVGCALVAQNEQRWMYVGDTSKSCDFARNMFLDILHREPISPITELQGKTIVRVRSVDGGEATFEFISLAAGSLLENRVRGSILQDYFFDAHEENMHRYNYSHPGVFGAMASRIEIAPC